MDDTVMVCKGCNFGICKLMRVDRCASLEHSAAVLICTAQYSPPLVVSISQLFGM